MKDIIYLKRITSLTGVLIAIIITATIPLVYLSTSYNHQTESLTTLANNAADDISTLIYSHPETWKYQIDRMEDILSQLPEQNEIGYTITDSVGSILIDAGPAQQKFTRSYDAALSDGEKNVGLVTITINLEPLLLSVATMFAIGLIIAMITYIVLRLLPFAALAKATQSLIDSRKELSIEIEAKEKALIEQQHATEKLHYQATHDTLTRLPNRNYFHQELDKYIAHAGSEIFWVITLDIDRFKEINDALGHQLGDEVLKEISQRLVNAATKNTLVARLGGDEFALLVHSTTQKELESILAHIHIALRVRVNIESFHLAIYASIGISQYPEHGTTEAELLRNADIAMYKSKRSGENWEYYDESINAATPNRLAMVAELRQALDNNQLEMHYQPKVSLITGETVGFEALARWNHRNNGFISPDVFIPIAEQTNMIHELTQWALETSITQLKKWHQSHNPQWSMSVNISARNLQNEMLSVNIEKLLALHSISAKYLTLEITETSIMNDAEQSQIIVRRLANLGLKISIDDFGTGYSSLAYLKRLDAHEVKIDRSFVMNLLSNSDDHIIVESTIKLAHDLNMDVIAEGVETRNVGELLRSIGCEHAQGNYYCQPRSSDDLDEWLSRNNSNLITQ